MSLEQAIIENTAALRTLISTLQAQPASVATVAQAPAAANDTPKPPAKKSAPAAKAEVTKAVAEQNQEAARAELPAAPVAVTYDDVKLAVLELVKPAPQGKGREAALKVLGKFGVEKAPDLKPEQYADCLQALRDALNAKDEEALA